mgnify:CR=1 FL=1
MALLFQTTITTPEGIAVENAYGRVAVINNVQGNAVEAFVNIYASEAAFENGSSPIFPIEMTLGGSTPYDYATGEKDILDLGHDICISVLAQQGVTAVKSL